MVRADDRDKEGREAARRAAERIWVRMIGNEQRKRVPEFSGGVTCHDVTWMRKMANFKSLVRHHCAVLSLLVPLMINTASIVAVKSKSDHAHLYLLPSGQVQVLRLNHPVPVGHSTGIHWLSDSF